MPTAWKLTDAAGDRADARARAVDGDGHGQARGGGGRRGVGGARRRWRAPGAVEVKVMVWVRLTAKLCWTWGAALQVVLPAWLASRVQVPGPWKLTTTPPVIEQTPELEASTVMVTVRPEVAVAVGRVGGASDGGARPAPSR